ncbi:MAG TPA: dihydrodipicolinate synthase family protein [Bacteroidales bacterium]|nr:dihydrodipicolinate synthase family protein [Bacteroidales bacterium]
MKKLSLAGIFPPLPTSFDKDENLLPEKIRFNINMLSKYDLSGFLILGSNGEQVMLSEKERSEAVAAAREALPEGKLLLAGTGGQSTRETISLTKAAAAAGADAVLVINPFYFKGLMTHEVIVKHYLNVADSSPVPVIVYNMPGNTGIDMSASMVIEMATHPNIAGMKESGGSVVKIGEILRSVNPDFQVLAGGAGFLLPALAMGAVGGILALSNIAPAQCIEIYRLFNAGDIVKARALQHKVIPVNAAVTSRWGVPALKAAMDHLGLYGGPARRPLLPLKNDVREQLLSLLKENDIEPFGK